MASLPVTVDSAVPGVMAPMMVVYRECMWVTAVEGKARVVERIKKNEELVISLWQASITSSSHPKEDSLRCLQV